MIEIRLEIECKNRSPLECINLLVERLENLVKNQDIAHYVVSMPSLEGDLIQPEAIHAGGKDVSP
jgi:hypothetical protein